MEQKGGGRMIVNFGHNGRYRMMAKAIRLYKSKGWRVWDNRWIRDERWQNDRTRKLRSNKSIYDVA